MEKSSFCISSGSHFSLDVSLEMHMQPTPSVSLPKIDSRAKKLSHTLESLCKI